MQASPSNSHILQTHRVSALAFSPRRDYCAIATKIDHTLRIFRVTTLNNIDSWKPLQEMRDHSQTISSIDWAQDNKIITVSHDRSGFVWRQVSQQKWQKMLVNIDIKLSVLVSKWAPSNLKFALGSSCNTLAIGYFSIVAQCWTVSAKSNLVKAPITTISFHPSSNLLALGSADFSVKIVGASFKKSKDELIVQSKVQNYNYQGPFKQVDSLFEVIYSFDNLGGWINHVSFEDNGNALLILPHTNSFKYLQISQGGNFVKSQQEVRWNGLPFLSGFLNKNRQLVLGGFDKKVAKFTKKGQYQFLGYCQKNEKTGVGKRTKGVVAGFTNSIEKKDNIFGPAPGEDQHTNFINVLDAGPTVSYDVNGIVHFWQ